MNSRTIITVCTAILLIAATAGGSNNESQQIKPSSEKKQSNTQTAETEAQPKEKVQPTCDGTTVTNDCSLDGINYATYILHPAVAEKSHTEAVTTYQEKITGYCTLCVDGTYSPSCALGRGACSWHGGVAEWNAPMSESVPIYTTKTVVDTPAQAEFFEKVPA